MKEQKRRQNELKFGSWTELANGGRLYTMDVAGGYGWVAKHVKEVDKDEVTLRFWQEIYDEHGKLVGTHEKYPDDKGHRDVQGG